MEPNANAFARNARKALSDRTLQEALGRTTGRFVAHRDAAAAAFPGFEATRERASAIKRETLARLGTHLARFIEEAERRGAVVHVARDAAQARAIAARIAADEGITHAVKSKSMAAEEISLNDALQAAGVEVVESDLGEFIIQLAGEPPSHIIAPAVHKTREEVSRLFERKLGEPPTDSIPELVGMARKHLRAKFLSAGMGVSGANFLIADTGSVVLVTNEGNGRMGTILPRVHLAVAGIEKVIPRMADLPAFLRLLPRSASGQTISSYVSVLTGTRRPGDAEGPERMHILLLDCGRSAILEGKYREVLKCVRCGACLNVCPVYQSVGGHAYGWVYSGPIGAVLNPLLLGLPEAAPLPGASTLCGACADVCPVKIPLPEFLLELRADEREQGLKTPGEIAGMKGYAAVMRRAGLLEAVERILGVVVQFFTKGNPVAGLPYPFSGWTERRDFPAAAKQPFRKQWKIRRGVRG
ncbi:MAG: iron-sulfur cluster-binding protein [Deltaproteobacteria bacterium]|nr:iron-sulfur cluster-binding protein [Deltaproteobacteria bacterium]